MQPPLIEDLYDSIKPNQPESPPKTATMQVSIKILLCLVLASAGYCEDCGDSVSCEEKKLVSLVDQFDSARSVSILGDAVQLERTGDSTAGSEEGLVERALRYLQNHELKIKVPQEAVRSLVSGKRSSNWNLFASC